MCGVFGFVADKGQRMNLKAVLAMAEGTEERGRDAFGFAWVDRRGVIRSYRQKGKISDALGLLAFARDAVMLIGHTRWATSGDPKSNINNHPHPCDGGWIVHNGVVQGHQDLADEHDLLLSSDCDSEIIARLIEDGEGDDRLARARWAIRQTSPGPLVVLGLWTDCMVVCRRGNPLSLSTRKEGLYLASLSDDLPGTPQPVQDETIRLITRNPKGAMHGTVLTIAAGASDEEVDHPFDRVTGVGPSEVRGGKRRRPNRSAPAGAR